MKAFYTITAILLCTFCYAQDEFSQTDNGLIYSEEAIGKLKHIVDSLNLKFKVCEEKAFYSKLQGKGSYITIKGPKAGEALKDIESGITLPELLKKYPEAKIMKELLLTKFVYKEYDGEDAVGFFNTEFTDSDDYQMTFVGDYYVKFRDVITGWVFGHSPKDEYYDEELNAFFLEGLKSVPLKEVYARKVQYSDCLIDTVATIYFKTAERRDSFFDNDNQWIGKFVKYMDKKTDKPRVDYDNYEAYTAALEKWKREIPEEVKKLVATDRKAKELHENAVDEGMNGKGNTNDEFEDYVAMVNKEDALHLKRNRRVVGMCSMDSSPRRHAVNIAELAAETTKWEIFLRSHLDIMNDRFDRVSDGSYAQKERKTYIKELEVLDINVSDLLLGICLRVENVSENHYFGNIGRIGRALSETKDRQLIEGEILSMIKDNELDDYNRALMYFLFLNYNYNIDNEQVRKDNSEKLKDAASYMPDYLKSKIKIED